MCVREFCFEEARCKNFRLYRFYFYVNHSRNVTRRLMCYYKIECVNSSQQTDFSQMKLCVNKATCLSDKHKLKDLHEKRTRWCKILLLQRVKQDSVSYVVVCYVTLPQHTIKNNKTDWFVCGSRPRALLRPVTCGKTGRRHVGGFFFLRLNCKTDTVRLEDARGKVQGSVGSYLYQVFPFTQNFVSQNTVYVH